MIIRRWWSVEVPGFEQLASAGPEEQVVQQIREIDKLIDTGRELIGKDRFFDVAYEDLCAESPKTLEGVEQFLGSHGVDLTHRGSLPESFPMPEPGEIDDGLLKIAPGLSWPGGRRWLEAEILKTLS